MIPRLLAAIILDELYVLLVLGLRFVSRLLIFALSSKTQYDLKFSDDEARGFKEILNMLSDDLGKISEAYASEASPGEGSAEQTSDAGYREPSQF